MSSNNFFKPDDVDSAVYIGTLQEWQKEYDEACNAFKTLSSSRILQDLPGQHVQGHLLHKGVCFEKVSKRNKNNPG